MWIRNGRSQNYDDTKYMRIWWSSCKFWNDYCWWEIWMTDFIMLKEEFPQQQGNNFPWRREETCDYLLSAWMNKRKRINRDVCMSSRVERWVENTPRITSLTLVQYVRWLHDRPLVELNCGEPKKPDRGVRISRVHNPTKVDPNHMF